MRILNILEPFPSPGVRQVTAVFPFRAHIGWITLSYSPNNKNRTRVAWTRRRAGLR